MESTLFYFVTKDGNYRGGITKKYKKGAKGVLRFNNTYRKDTK